MHDRRTVFPYLESYPRDGSTLLLDAGDAIRGSNTVFHLHEPILDLMNTVGYDAQAFGNREFNYLRSVLGRRFRQVKHPFVCANVVDLRRGTEGMWRPTLVRSMGGRRIGIIGLTPVQYLDGSPWQWLFGFRFSRPFDFLPDLVRQMRAESDMVLLLSHSGYKTDCKIAEQVEGIDLIVGGHSHTLLETPLKVRDTFIVQTGCYGRFVGKMHFTLDGGFTIKDYALVPMPNAEPMPAGLDPQSAAALAS